MANANPEVKERIKPKLDLQPPSLYKVIYMNDEVTTMEFVVMSLVEVFNHSPQDADVLCHAVHEDGSAVVAILPYELAEQKGVETTVLARNNGFPLLIRLEPAV
jgi:ATP-dependent Clp protease adaptor protein ClpS